MNNFRENGAFGALLDEYEKAVAELQSVIEGISEDELTAIADPSTSDKDCKSVQTVLAHVVRAGIGYVVEIRKSVGESVEFPSNKLLNSVEAYQTAIDEMFRINEQLMSDYPDLVLEEYSASKKIKVRWGQLYDVEQLLEHAILHILRHRRQIQKFLIQLRT